MIYTYPAPIVSAPAGVQLVYDIAQGQFSAPKGIAVTQDPDPVVYVCGGTNNDVRIQMFDHNGGYLGFLSDTVLSLGWQYVAIDPSGNIYAATFPSTSASVASVVRKWGKTNVLLLRYGGLGTGNGLFETSATRAIATDSFGNVFVGDNGATQIAIQKFNSAGVFLLRWNPQLSVPFAQPNGVACDQFDNVYMTDTNNNVVHKYDNLGNFILQWGAPGAGNGQFSGPNGIIVDKTRNLVYVADGGNNRVQWFDLVGNYLGQFGSIGTGNGQFTTPDGIAVDHSGNIWVVDRGNARVQKWSSAQVFQFAFGTSGTQRLYQYFPPSQPVVG